MIEFLGKSNLIYLLKREVFLKKVMDQGVIQY